jgi:hypothetical protein
LITLEIIIPFHKTCGIILIWFYHMSSAHLSAICAAHPTTSEKRFTNRRPWWPTCPNRSIVQVMGMKKMIGTDQKKQHSVSDKPDEESTCNRPGTKKSEVKMNHPRSREKTKMNHQLASSNGTIAFHSYPNLAVHCVRVRQCTKQHRPMLRKWRTFQDSGICFSSASGELSRRSVQE